jgi:predicted ester cyclase
MTDQKQLAIDGWDAYFRHDLDACLAVYASDAELIMPGMQPITGVEAIRATWEMFQTAFPDERPVEPLKHIAEGNTVVTIWKTEATHSGPLPLPTGDMLPPTGRKTLTSGVTVQEIEADKCKRQIFYYDNAEFMQQLGLMPEVAART